MAIVAAPIIRLARGAADKVRTIDFVHRRFFSTAGVGIGEGSFATTGADMELIRMNAKISVTAPSTGDIELHEDLRFRGRAERCSA